MLTIKQLCRESHSTAKAKGFWDKERNKGELIALMHSELSEMLEAIRHGNSVSEHISTLSSEAEEAADLAIRLGDYCEGNKIDLEKAIKLKMKFNKNRERLHGKKF